MVLRRGHTMLGSNAFAVDTVNQSGFSQSNRLPVRSGPIRAAIARLPCTATGS